MNQVNTLSSLSYAFFPPDIRSPKSFAKSVKAFFDDHESKKKSFSTVQHCTCSIHAQRMVATFELTKYVLQKPYAVNYLMDIIFPNIDRELCNLQLIKYDTGVHIIRFNFKQFVDSYDSKDYMEILGIMNYCFQALRDFANYSVPLTVPCIISKPNIRGLYAPLLAKSTDASYRRLRTT